MCTATIDKAAPTTGNEEETVDTLIAISVVAKRLAKEIQSKNEKKGDKSDEESK